MPRLDFTGRYLDDAYPSIVAPADDRLDGMAADEYDAVFQHGLRIAEEIRSQMHLHGRKRHFDDGTTTTTNTTTTTTDAEKMNDKFAVNENKVAPHHRAGIADPQRDRHAGRQPKDELGNVNNLDEHEDMHDARFLRQSYVPAATTTARVFSGRVMCRPRVCHTARVYSGSVKKNHFRTQTVPH